LVHMPAKKQYSVFRAERVSDGWPGNWRWTGRAVDTADSQDVKIDFANDSPNVQVMDVNGDGFVDVVFSSATELQTFFSLGRHPGGDDQFGHATRTSATTSEISTSPITACIPCIS